MKRFPFLAVIIAATLIAAVILFLERVERGTPCGKVSPLSRQGPGKEAPGKALKGKTPGQKVKPAAPRAEHRGRPIAIIIDDIGFDLRVVEELAGMPAPIAFAVLPHTPHAAEAARLLHAAGKEILLHLPMEPRFYPEESPGAGALLADMDEKQIRRQVREDLAAVPYVSGVNNHMGSRFMEDEARMTMVMEELGKRGLYFVDSRTTADSRGREAAARAGVRFAARAVFIDPAPGYAAALENLTGASRRGGKNSKPVLIIGHPHPETVRALKDVLPRWRAEGVRLVAVPACIETGDTMRHRVPLRDTLATSDNTSDRKERVR